MNYSFEYIDIILLAMIAGFIFLRLRGILGKRTGFEGKSPAQFKEVLKNIKVDQAIKPKEKFDDEAQKEFLKGAKIAYETIITDFSDNDNKLIASKPLLSKEIYEEFNKALKVVEELKSICNQIGEFINDDKEGFAVNPGQVSFAKAVEFGASSIDVEILCYSAERDYSHYTDLKQKLVHKVMEIVRENGSDFAFPSRSVYVESSHETES